MEMGNCPQIMGMLRPPDFCEFSRTEEPFGQLMAGSKRASPGLSSTLWSSIHRQRNHS
jgi:hypothetical protein